MDICVDAELEDALNNMHLAMLCYVTPEKQSMPAQRLHEIFCHAVMERLRALRGKRLRKPHVMGIQLHLPLLIQQVNGLAQESHHYLSC